MGLIKNLFMARSSSYCTHRKTAGKNEMGLIFLLHELY